MTTTTFRDAFTREDGLPVAPIVLGVVGHRGVDDSHREALKRAVVSILQEFRQAYPQTPVLLLSALAEGADQIAAEAAVEVEGAFVQAPLPFDREVYKQSTSFDGPAARDAFDSLLANTGKFESLVVPLPEDLSRRLQAMSPLKVATERNDPEIKALRHACYANVGGYVTRRCHALIALWDGQEADLDRPSGTGEYVAMKLFGRAPKLYPWTNTFPLGFLGDRGLVFGIHTPKTPEPGSTSAPTTQTPGELRVLVPNDHGRFWEVSRKTPHVASYRSAGRRFCRRVVQSFGIGIDHSDLKPHAQELKKTSASTRFVRKGKSLVRRVLYKVGFGLNPSDPIEYLRPRRVDSELRQFRELCTTIEEFNRDVTSPPLTEEIRKRLDKIGTSLQVAAFDERHNQWLKRIGKVRESAAALANRLEGHSKYVLRAIFFQLVVGVALFHCYAHLGRIDPEVGHMVHNPFYLVGFAVTLVGAFAVVIWSWWTRLDQRRLDARTLAESLRVRLSWAKAGVGRSVADGYLSQLRSELSWIRQAVFQGSPPATVWSEQFNRLEESDRVVVLRDLQKSWVQGQKWYFAERREDYHKHATRLRSLGFVLALAAWFLLVRSLFSPWHVETLDKGQDANLHIASSPRHPTEELLIGTSLAVICGGLLIAYSERRSHEELARQFERMEVVFDHGDKELSRHLDRSDPPPDSTIARRVIEELGRESMMEHAHWLLLRRSRPLELQIGG